MKSHPPPPALPRQPAPAGSPVRQAHSAKVKPAPPAPSVPLPDEFFGQLTHEIRTPVSAIRTAAVLLRHHGKDLTAPAELRWIEAILQGCTGLGHTLAQLDELRRVLQAEPDHGAEARALRSWLEGVIKEMASPQAETAPRFAVTTPPAARWRFDASLVGAALRPLLSNAIKFGPAGSTVELTARPVPDFGLELSVTDRGPGVDPDEVDRLFVPFFQGRNSRDLPGCGLGLAIARTAALRLGGGIRYARRSDGSTVFHLRVPAAAAHAGTGRSAAAAPGRD